MKVYLTNIEANKRLDEYKVIVTSNETFCAIERSIEFNVQSSGPAAKKNQFPLANSTFKKLINHSK
jgi:hypothetical protein